MLILLHVIIAITSIITTFFAFIHPTNNRLRVSYILAGLTLVTGTYLIVTMSTHMVQSCLMGIAYFVGVSTALIVARKKYTKEYIGN